MADKDPSKSTPQELLQNANDPNLDHLADQVNQMNTRRPDCFNFSTSFCAYGAGCRYYHDHDNSTLATLSRQMDVVIAAVAAMNNDLQNLHSTVIKANTSHSSYQDRGQPYYNVRGNRGRPSRSRDPQQQDQSSRSQGKSPTPRGPQMYRPRSSSQNRLRHSIQRVHGDLNTRLKLAMDTPSISK